MIFSVVDHPRAEEERPSALIRTRLGRELTQRDLVEQGIDVLASYFDGRVDLAVTDKQLAWIHSKIPVVAVLERARLAVPMVLDENLGQYHTYDEMETMLNSLASTYPNLTHLTTLGTSIQGRQIWAIKISDNPDTDEDEPEVLIMGCHHAREIMSVEIPLLFAEYLLTHYVPGSQVKELVDEREIWIVPMINPDGHVYVQYNHEGDWWTWWRKNRRDNGAGSYGVDLNRNYGYMWGYDDIGSSPDPSSTTYRGTAPFSEPETQAVRDFCASKSFKVALSYHSYGELILFPWGYAPIYTADHNLFLALGDSLQRWNSYTLGCNAMGTIYLTNGDTDDWAYGDTSTKDRLFCFTVELNSYEEGGFAPPENLIAGTFLKVLDANLTLIRRADNPYSVLGPEPPHMYDVALLAPPSYKLQWSDGHPADPNPPVSWELVEYKDLSMVTDSCRDGSNLWILNGFSESFSRAHDGDNSYYSGVGDNLHHTMRMNSIYPVSFGETLSCWLWYDIEPGWDYAYLEASNDQGMIWWTVPGNRTTDDNPHGLNRGNGITGNSGGWVQAEFYLDSIGIPLEANDILLLRFSYMTDSHLTMEGMYIDSIYPTIVHEEKTSFASLPDTFYVITPEAIGHYAYLVRAADAENHRGLWSDVVFHTVTDLTAAGTPALRTMLAQNFPNPFNPTTTIRFVVGAKDLDASGTVHVLLELYDVSGRRIAVLKDAPVPSGEYSVAWNGKGTEGRDLASGVYFARLVVGEIVRTRKMVLLK